MCNNDVVESPFDNQCTSVNLGGHLIAAIGYSADNQFVLIGFGCEGLLWLLTHRFREMN